MMEWWSERSKSVWGVTAGREGLETLRRRVVVTVVDALWKGVVGYNGESSWMVE